MKIVCIYEYFFFVYGVGIIYDEGFGVFLEFLLYQVNSEVDYFILGREGVGWIIVFEEKY